MTLHPSLVLRGILLGWIGVGLALLVGLGWEVQAWRSLDVERDRTGAERASIERQIQAQEEEIRREERAHSDLLHDLQWSSNRGDPSAFLTGLADFAQGARLKVTAVGPLERQAVSQFSKSWHAVQVVGPFREVKDLATRIEQEGGILEDVSIETTTATAGRAGAADEVQARMNVTVVELTPGAKAILQRATTATSAGGKPEPAVALPPPPARPAPPRSVRDPFAFAGPAAAPRVVVAAPGPPPATASPAADGGAPAMGASRALELRGVIKFPGGHLAILNNHIAQVGDVVEGHHVEQITESRVVVRQPPGAARTLTLPEIAAPSAPAAPRR